MNPRDVKDAIRRIDEDLQTLKAQMSEVDTNVKELKKLIHAVKKLAILRGKEK